MHLHCDIFEAINIQNEGYSSVKHTLNTRQLLIVSTAILQKVLSASVTVDKVKISEIGKGILVFAAIAPGDTEKDAENLANKILKFKLWDDEETGARVRGISLHLPQHQLLVLLLHTDCYRLIST